MVAASVESAANAKKATSENLKISRGKKNLKLIENTFKRNSSSDYTEQMSNYTENFEYEANKDIYWTLPEFSLLYGSPVYEQASPEQKKALNHLYWICFYNYSIGGEVATMVFNQLTCGAFYHLGGYETVCRELDIETSQERTHVESFRKVGHMTEAALLGGCIFERPIPNYSQAAVAHPQGNRRPLIGRVFSPIGLAYQREISISPFLATHYYAIRGLRNIQLKVKEYQHSQYFKQQEENEAPIAAPTAISHYHYLDEAFHTATSQLLSHEVYKDFPKPTAYELFLANFMFYGAQTTVNHLSCAVPGIFSSDANYIPLIYQMLQTPLFGLSAQEALDSVKACFCQEHEGFHVAAKYHQRALQDCRKYLEDLDYLLPINRDLRLMATATVEKALTNNIKTFKRFKQTVTV